MLSLNVFDIFWYLEAGAREEKDNIWRAAQEEVWNARRLWMGRGVTGMARRRLYHLVAWRLGLQSLSSRQNAILLLFLGGFQKLIALVIIYDFPVFIILVIHGACPHIGTLVGLNRFISLTCFLIFLLQGKLAKRFILTTRCGLVGITSILLMHYMFSFSWIIFIHLDIVFLQMDKSIPPLCKCAFLKWQNLSQSNYSDGNSCRT